MAIIVIVVKIGKYLTILLENAKNIFYLKLQKLYLMPGEKHIDKPRDEGTKSKLEIFKQYFEEWPLVFVSAKKIYWKNAQVFYPVFVAGTPNFKNRIIWPIVCVLL
jgi:hypothetical protein